MDNQDWVLGAGLSLDLEHAVKRAGGLPKDIKSLSNGDTFAKILPFLRGEAEINITKYMIDLDADPFCPEGWKVESHRKGGLIEYTPKMIRLFWSEHQKDGGSIQGHKLREEWNSQPVANANLLDWYLANPDKIPEDWKPRGWIVFPGTTYRRPDDSLIVRCLYWRDDTWDWIFVWLGCGFDESDPAAVSASQP